MNSGNDQCMLFFTKWPEPGQVKTRLGRDIGNQHAARLYKLFVQDLCAQLRSLELRATCCYAPAHERKRFGNWLGDDFDYLAQQGRDLGERMVHAFQWAFSQGFFAALIIGMDSPDLPAEYLIEARMALTRQDAVIGPSQDGGYYLIGFQRERFLPEAFAGIDWSTGRVCAQTTTRLCANGRSLHRLPTWFDIDTGRDLEPLVRRNQATAFARSQSYRFVCQQLGHEAVEMG